MTPEQAQRLADFNEQEVLVPSRLIGWINSPCKPAVPARVVRPHRPQRKTLEQLKHVFCFASSYWLDIVSAFDEWRRSEGRRG